MAQVPIQLASGPVVVEAPIGAGGSARVWAVRTASDPPETGLVLKVGRSETSRFLASEAERLALACSADLPDLRDVGRLPTTGLPLAEWHGAPYLLMTRLPGRSLSQLLEKLRFDQSRSESRHATRTGSLALALARDVGRALADLHEAGVAHGDVKPDNILVAGDGSDETPWQARLCDLGLATTGEQWLGATPAYLPPEFHNPKLGPSQAKTRDLWALGVTLREALLLQGQTPPSDGRALPPLPESAPPSLRAIIDGLCASTPAARPRARWVSEQAGAKPGPDDHRAAIKRQYLQVRGDFCRKVLEGHAFEVDVAGVAGTWLTDVTTLLTRIPLLTTGEPQATSGARALVTPKPLAAEERRRLLVALCGAAAIDYPTLPDLDESAFLSRLLGAAMRRAPGAFTRDLFGTTEPSWLTEGSLSPESEFSGTIDLMALALELGSDQPSPAALLQVERAALEGSLPLPLALCLAQALKRHGELGRARAVLLGRNQAAARVALAGILARSGAVDEALTVCAELPPDAETDVRGAAAALGARLHLSRGDLVAAAASLDRAPDTAAVLEARASLELSHQRRDAARQLIERARGLSADAEQSARLLALLAHLEHQDGHHEAALRSYERAASDAARVGALVEEATYLVGVASTAVHLGKSGVALAALRRADLLFEVVGNPAAQARAALNRASALATVGAFAEATSAAGDAVERARKVRDLRCEAWSHLVLAAHGPRDVAADHWERARGLLAPVTAADELRLEACALGWQSRTPDECRRLDDAAAECPDVEVQLEWWGERAHALISASGEQLSSEQLSGERSHNDRAVSERILTALSRLASQPAPLDVVGQAYARGAELAAHVGDGDRSLQFIALARDAHRQIVDGAPAELRLAARQLPWALWLQRNSSESPLRAEQIGEIERLIKDLADRSRLGAVLERSLDALIRWTGVERGLLLMSAPEGKLVPRAARNLARRDLSTEQRELSQTLARRALETGDCVVAMDASGELPSLHHSVHALKLRSVLAVPLIARGETVGVVYLDDRMRRGAFGSSELAWVRLVGTIAAVAIGEARDQARLRRAARRAARAEQRLSQHLTNAESELARTRVELSAQQSVVRHGLIGASAPMLALYQLIDRVGPSEIPVLIFGESGTGKELVARALHRSSPRKDRPFVGENCGAIPAPLLESILFGHKKGAFTGAIQNHAGLFETASGGTLFLDELGEMSLPMQAKLLRVLETGELRRVGDDRVTKVDVRVLGASHRNLAQMVTQGSFREDLYYRLNVITIPLPALRERASDIPDLVRHFLGQARRSKSLAISAAALSALQGYNWPGNVRQLENELRRAAVLADDCILPEHLSTALVAGAPTATASPGAQTRNLKQQVDALETQLISRALREAAGNQSRAAEALGISRFGLQKMLKRLGLTLPK